MATLPYLPRFLLLLSHVALVRSFDAAMLLQRLALVAPCQQSGHGCTVQQSPQLERVRRARPMLMEAPEDDSMLKMFGEMFREVVKGPDPIPPPAVERAVPPLPEDQKEALADMDPAAAVEYAIGEGRKFYTFQQISGFMREQAKAEQCLGQAELSISLLRSVVDGGASAGVDETLLQEARRLIGELEQERLSLLADSRKRGMEL